MASSWNRRRVLAAMTTGVVALGLGLSGVSAAQDSDGLAKLPAKVKEAADKAIAKAKWMKASKSEEDGKVLYMVEGEDADKRPVWVELTEDAKVVEAGYKVAVGKVPPVVTAALKKEHPRFATSTIFEVHHAGKVARYDFDGKRPSDIEEVTVTVSLDGKDVEMDEEIDLDKVPAKVKAAADKALAKAEWTEAFMLEEEGKGHFMLEGTDAEKREVWIKLTADAKVIETGFKVAMAKVPPVVAAALKKKYPRFVAATTYEVHHQAKVIRYDFEGKRPSDTDEVTISVSADGKEIEVDED